MLIRDHKINDKVLSKDEINKLSDKDFMKEWEKGNISMKDFLDFGKRPTKFNQVEVARNCLEM